ncbi:MAG TPA: RNA-binding protein [Thermoplasmata archaeon]|nr:MAG: RNA-binding protein [Euryarchaeota archaeon]HTD80882.1 RNA-binding protein [Thermoplasmata archaeon]
MRIRRRQRLRRKEINAYSQGILDALDVDPFRDRDDIDLAEAGEWKLLIADDEVRGILVGDRPFLTVRGLLKYPATKRWVTVDMGAVPFVYNGADVMAPGIVDAEPGIQPGDLVWVRDEKNRRPLAIGEALMSGPGMVASQKGKAIRSIHHVGDALWKLDEEPRE